MSNKIFYHFLSLFINTFYNGIKTRFEELKRQLKDNLDKPEDEIIPCRDKDLWLSPTVYKYYSDSTKTNGRATKNFTSLEEANAYATSKGKGIVKTVLGTPKRCMYCPAYSICSQRRRYYND